MTTDTRVAEALEKIAELQKGQFEALEHVAQTMTCIYDGTVGEDTDQPFWDRAFCAALTGLLAWQGWSITTEAVGVAVETADIALAARQRKESE